MITRRQLPVHSPLRAGWLLAAARAAVRPSAGVDAVLTEAIQARLTARRVVLTDSGTSALVLALRMLCGHDGTVALPAYACIDLTSAAIYAGVRVRLYDVDSNTLGPDLVSFEEALAYGVDAAVVAPLYGYPCDMHAVNAIASRYGVPVIEDAAQAGGATFDEMPIGSFGTLSVLSFGRGKGMTAGSGGALLSRDAARDDAMRQIEEKLMPAVGDWRVVAATTAQWLFGRPELYALPASLPMLKLGEMVYREAHEPRRISAAAAAILPRAMAADPVEVSRRRANAATFDDAARDADVRVPQLPNAANCGYLRFVVIDQNKRLVPRPSLGILPGYPATLADHGTLRPHLLGAMAQRLNGARTLQHSLYTLPTHSLLSSPDRQEVCAWLSGANRRRSAARPLADVA